MTPILHPTSDSAASSGFATFNHCPHLCVEIPNGMSTISVRTTEGKQVTFSFLPYQDGGPPQCIDIQHQTAPEITVPCPSNPKGKKVLIQSLVGFNPFGSDSFRRNNHSEGREIVALTTLILQTPE